MRENVLFQDFLLELGHIMSRWARPWCVGDDFNEVQEPGERSRGGDRRTWGMALFSEFALREMFIVGSFCTWLNSQENPSYNKLDRFLVSVEWEELFSDLVNQFLN